MMTILQLKLIARKWIPAFAGMTVFLSGCASNPIYRPLEVKIPVVVPCRVSAVERPVWAAENLGDEAHLFPRVQALLIEREQRTAYELQLEAAIKACQ